MDPGLVGSWEPARPNTTPLVPASITMSELIPPVVAPLSNPNAEEIQQC